MKINIWNLAVQFFGRTASLCVGAALVVAWAITGPLFYLNDLAQDRFNKKAKGTL